MGRALGLAVGGLMVVLGVVWTLQGLGYLGGSSMTGDTIWAVIGPIIAVVGLALGLWAFRRTPPGLD